MGRIVSLSLAPYDGHPVEVALDSAARCGVRYVEPAFIVGYTEPFDESAFTSAEAALYAAALGRSGLLCHAVSSHIDLGRPDAVAVFKGRMDFARAIGARLIATNAAVRTSEAAFWHNIEPLARHAEAIGLTIGLENPGDGRSNLIDSAADGISLVERIGSPAVRLNYDPGNTASHLPAGPDPADDAVRALPACAHLHLKDVRRINEGWYITPIGEGDIDCQTVLAALAGYPDLPFSIELPLRMHRGPDALPVRNPAPVALDRIEAAIGASLGRVAATLGCSSSA